MLIRSGEALGIGWSRNMLYSGFNILPRSVVRRQTGFAARITRTLYGLHDGSEMNALSSRLHLFHGDITHLDVDAVVTAANESLIGGGGVDGAVHDAAGPELLAACRYLSPCPAGEARLTQGYNLKANQVIHAVGPVYDSSKYENGEKLLAAAYRSSLTLANENMTTSIAFPCISTGAFGFPADSACRIAIETTLEWLRSHEHPKSATFCCFEWSDYALYQDRFAELGIN